MQLRRNRELGPEPEGSEQTVHHESPAKCKIIKALLEQGLRRWSLAKIRNLAQMFASRIFFKNIVGSAAGMPARERSFAGPASGGRRAAIRNPWRVRYGSRGLTGVFDLRKELLQPPMA